MVVGDVSAVERLAKQSLAACRAARRLERRLARKRKVASVATQAQFAQAVHFLQEERTLPSALLLDQLRAELIAKRLPSGRHAFLVMSTCNNRALLVAPKREGATVAMAASNSIINIINDKPLHLLTITKGTVPLLFTGTTAGNASIMPIGIGIVGVHVGSVKLMLLTSISTEVNVRQPRDLGLTETDFVSIQEDSVKLLGLSPRSASACATPESMPVCFAS